MQYNNPFGSDTNRINNTKNNRLLSQFRRRIISLVLGMSIVAICLSTLANSLISAPFSNSYAAALTTAQEKILETLTSQTSFGTFEGLLKQNELQYQPCLKTNPPKNDTCAAFEALKSASPGDYKKYTDGYKITTPTTGPGKTSGTTAAVTPPPPGSTSELFAPQSTTKVTKCDFSLFQKNNPDNSVDAANGVLATCFKDILSIVIIISIVITLGKIGITAIALMNPLQDPGKTQQDLTDQIIGLIVGGLIVGSFGIILFTLNPASTRLDGIFSPTLVCEIRKQINLTIATQGGKPIPVEADKCADPKIAQVGVKPGTGVGTTSTIIAPPSGSAALTDAQLKDYALKNIEAFKGKTLLTQNSLAQGFKDCVATPQPNTPSCKIFAKIKTEDQNVYDQIVKLIKTPPANPTTTTTGGGSTGAGTAIDPVDKEIAEIKQIEKIAGITVGSIGNKYGKCLTPDATDEKSVECQAMNKIYATDQALWGKIEKTLNLTIDTFSPAYTTKYEIKIDYIDEAREIVKTTSNGSTVLYLFGGTNCSIADTLFGGLKAGSSIPIDTPFTKEKLCKVKFNTLP
jgi:hypothetical protein